jgi:hypothetical protein
MRPLSASRPPRPAGVAAVRRASPAIAGPLFVLIVVAAVVAGGLFVASLPGGVDSGIVAIASATPTRTPRPTVRPTPVPVVQPTAAPTPTPIPKVTPKPPAGAARDLCDPILGFACGLERGTYEPSRFVPPIRFKLRDGWSTSLWEPDLIALGRHEGGLTFASGLMGVYPNGAVTDAPGTRRSLVEAFIGTDGVAAGRPHDIRVDKRRATVVDLAPTGPDRVALFGTSTQTYYLEAYGTTRIVVIDADDGPVVLAIEPLEDSTLEAVLTEADRVVDSIRFR